MKKIMLISFSVLLFVFILFSCKKSSPAEPSAANTPLATMTAELTPSVTQSLTQQNSPTIISTRTSSPTASSTLSGTSTATQTKTQTPSMTFSSTPTVTVTATNTKTPEWTIAGAANFSDGDARNIKIKCLGNEIFSSYTDAGLNQPFIKRFSSNVWSDSNNTGLAGSVVQNGLYLSGSSIFWATYTVTGNDNIYSYYGGSWDTSFYVDYNCKNYAVAVDSSYVYAAGILLTGAEYALRVYAHDGITVSDITAPMNITGLTQTYDSPAVEVYNGALHVACYDPISNSPVVRSYTGSGWVNADNYLDIEGHPQNISLVKNGSYLYMSFLMSGFPYVYYYDGGAWYDLESYSIAPAGSGMPAIDVYNGKVYIAYTDASAADKVTVKKYDGAWTTVGTAGFTGFAASTYGVSISINQYGVPYVGYGNSGDGNKGIVMKYE